jgi:hypothetical protein
MGRIRSVKPEFNSNEGLSALSAQAHLLAEALLCYADDEGYFNANPTLVRAGTCPLRKDFKHIEKFLEELASIGYLRFGNCKGKRYGQIVKFKNHQKISHPSKSKIINMPILWEDAAQSSRETPETLAQAPESVAQTPEVLQEVQETLRPDQGSGNRDQGTGNGEQGTGEADSGKAPESAEAPCDSLSPKNRWKNRMLSQRVNAPLSDEAQMIAQEVIVSIGVSSSWTRDEIAKQADQELKKHPNDLDGICKGMVEAWREYCRCAASGKLSKIASGPEKFYSDGRWRSSKLWGLKTGMHAYENMNAA